METKSGRSSKMSHRSTSSLRITRPGSAVGLILERINAFHADTRNYLGAVNADLEAVVLATRGVRETVIPRLERIGTSPASKFVVGLDLNPSLSSEMTAAPTHSSISLEAKQGNPEVSTAPVVLRRSERLVNKPKVDYRQVAFLPRWPTATTVSSNPCPAPTLYPSSSFAALQQHANPSAFEAVPATLVERGRNVTIYLIIISL